MDTEVAAAAAPASNPYGFGALIDHGTSVSYTILGILLIMSLVSWYITFTKYWDQYRLGKSARNVEKNFWAAGSAREGADRLPKDDDFRAIAESALRAAAHHEGRLGDRISLRDWVDMALTRAVDNLRSKLSGGLSFLATVGSTAPFVGLLGTVYGILKALIKTALGLVVAVPAVFAYNILLKRNKAIEDIMREFTGDLEANLIGGVKPDVHPGVRPAAPAAVKK